MLISRAPLRISFVGGGTDIKEFYDKYPGRVISVSIDKFVYTVINHAELLDKFMIKYAEVEVAKNPDDLKHTRFREAFKKLGIDKGGMEIASFADLPAKTGLGSSSSFSVALMKALHANKGKKISKQEAAEEACDLEINILKEPIGKQDQYAAAYGGFNVIQFNPDGTVDVEPVFLDFKTRSDFEDHLLLFFTGMTRAAGDVLADQKERMADNFETYKQMSDSVLEFRDKLMAGDFRGLADMMSEGWKRKKSLGTKITNNETEVLYEAAIKKGAWGGKILGAGGGGCLLFIAPPEKHEDILNELQSVVKSLNIEESREIPFKFSQTGADILFNSSHHDND